MISFDKIISNRTTILKNALSTILLLAIFVIEGCFNFLTFEFTFYKLLEIGFWINIGIKIVLLLLVKSWVMSIFIPIARMKNVDLLYQKSVNECLMRRSKDNNFSYWVENNENVDIRIEFWKRKINKKIVKLERKAKTADRMLYFNNNDLAKRGNKYCEKRKSLETLISDEYIQENISWLDVKCPKVDSAVFDCPVTNENINAKYQLSAKTKSAIFASLLIASIMFFAIQTIWNSIELFQSDADILIIIVGLLMDMVFLLWQGLGGINLAFNIVDSQEVLPYANRNRILEKYLYFKNNDKVAEVKEYLIAMKKECKENGQK